MNLEMINRLFLELSRFATATTARELALLDALKNANSICRSMHSIAERRGKETAWDTFGPMLDKALTEQHAILHPAPPCPPCSP